MDKKERVFESEKTKLKKLEGGKEECRANDMAMLDVAKEFE